MSDKYSATSAMLGYLYQAQYALYLLLTKHDDDAEISIEKFDDVSFDENGTPRELLQFKHHINNHVSLSDRSVDLWKTIRIWSDQLKENKIKLPKTLLVLITTSKAPDDSIASVLRADSNRNSQLAIEKLIKISKSNNNEALSSAINSFENLTMSEKELLINSIYILDSSPNISDISIKIKESFELSVSTSHLDALYERLEGWWFSKITTYLMGDLSTPISRLELHTKTIDLVQQFGPEALPIDYLEEEPPYAIDVNTDNRNFVIQLKYIALHNTRIVKAIRDYYRAYEQRSKWMREDLLLEDELETYEIRLVDEWERVFYSCQQKLLNSESVEEEYQKCGREIFDWIDIEATILIRPRVTAPYVMRGSYHMLADELPPRIVWHPKFVEKINSLLVIPKDTQQKQES